MLRGSSNFLRNVVDGLGARKACENNRGLASDPTGVGPDNDASRRQFSSSRRIDIKSQNAPSAINKVTGDRASHDAEPDNPDGFVHITSIPTHRIRLTRNSGRALTSN